MNSFIIKGLRRYGYVDLAEELKAKTLEAVNKWYKKTGVLYEFYDSKDEFILTKVRERGSLSRRLIGESAYIRSAI